MSERRHASIYYQRKAHVDCPSKWCGGRLEYVIDDPANIEGIPQVGETLVCPACAISFVIESEELY